MAFSQSRYFHGCGIKNFGDYFFGDHCGLAVFAVGMPCRQIRRRNDSHFISIAASCNALPQEALP